MPTISDVARIAGVSTATVSRVLNGNSGVDRGSVARVLEAVEQLEYRPSRLARSLRRRTTALWALVVSDVENSFFTRMVRGVEDVAQAEGYSVFLCNSDENIEKENQYLEVALAERVAGVIVVPASEEHTDPTPLIRSGTPVVAVDRRLRKSRVDTVTVDNIGGADSAVSHLIERGFRRIGCITGPQDVTTAEQRYKGYARAYRAAGMPLDAELVRYADFKEAGGYEAVRSLMDSSAPPDALFIGNNLMVLGGVRALREMPEHRRAAVPVVAFDDSSWAALLDPPLTVVSQPTYELGREAARLLVRRLTHPTAPYKSVKLQARLVVRDPSWGHGSQKVASPQGKLPAPSADGVTRERRSASES